jgi:hypothetical protein
LRALGRGVEHHALAHVARLAAAQGLPSFDVRFEPTAKNRPVLDFAATPRCEPRRCGEATVFTIASDARIEAIPAAPLPAVARPPAPGRGSRAGPMRAGSLASPPSSSGSSRSSRRSTRGAIGGRRQRAWEPASPRAHADRAFAGGAGMLRVDHVGIDDNFLSWWPLVLCRALVHELRQSTRVEVPLRQLFERPTIRDLAAALDGGIGAGNDRNRSIRFGRRIPA